MPDSGSEGRAFESHRGHNKKRNSLLINGLRFLIYVCCTTIAQHLGMWRDLLIK